MAWRRGTKKCARSASLPFLSLGTYMSIKFGVPFMGWEEKEGVMSVLIFQEKKNGIWKGFIITVVWERCKKLSDF